MKESTVQDLVSSSDSEPSPKDMSLLSTLLQYLKKADEANLEYLNSRAHKEVFAKNRADEIDKYLSWPRGTGLTPYSLVSDYLKRSVFDTSVRAGRWSSDSDEKKCKGTYNFDPLSYNLMDMLDKLANRIMRAAGHTDSLEHHLPGIIFDLIDLAICNKINPLAAIETYKNR